MHVLILWTTSSCIRLKHIAISAMPSIRYMEQKMKLISISWLLITRSPGTMSPNPIVLRLMKQK
jgi:hypothetical protein